MEDSYTSVYLRRSFHVPEENEVSSLLKLGAYSDDGAIFWINGVEVARVNMREGDHPFDGRESTSRIARLNESTGVLARWHFFIRVYLVPRNWFIMAIQAFYAGRYQLNNRCLRMFSRPPASGVVPVRGLLAGPPDLLETGSRMERNQT